MSIQGFYLMPHPPIVIPEVGKGEENKIKTTSESLYKISKEIKEKAPSTIILVTPHGTMLEDSITMIYEDSISGSLKDFGVPEINMDLSINKALTDRIYEITLDQGISSTLITNNFLQKYCDKVNLDHGALVPLYFINKHYSNFKLIHITYAPLSDIELYKFGMTIAKAVDELSEDTVFIASGDLSHKLKEESPYKYSPYGEKFDREFLNHLKNGDTVNAINMDNTTVSNAGECGRNSVVIMLGALEGKKFSGELLSYEGIFGIGYGVMKFNIISKDTSKLEDLKSLIKSQQDDPYVKLARESLTTYLTTGDKLQHLPDYITEDMKNNKRGVFVSLKKKGELRGCIGTILPTTSSLAEEIINNAIEAGIYDPRFYEVRKDELLDIDFSVDILTEPEITTKNQLDPKIYGVIVKSLGHTGLLLPNLEGVDTVDNQVSITLRKAGISENEAYTVERFKVIRHIEK